MKWKEMEMLDSLYNVSSVDSDVSEQTPKNLEKS